MATAIEERRYTKGNREVIEIDSSSLNPGLSAIGRLEIYLANHTFGPVRTDVYRKGEENILADMQSIGLLGRIVEERYGGPVKVHREKNAYSGQHAIIKDNARSRRCR